MKTEHLKEATRLGLDVVNSVNAMEDLVDALLAEKLEANKKLAEQQEDECKQLLWRDAEIEELTTILAKAKVTITNQSDWLVEWRRYERLWKDQQIELAEAQARIKVLEDALVNAVIPLRGIDMRNHSELAKYEVMNAIAKIDSALSTTSPTSELDNVVREAVEKEREQMEKQEPSYFLLSVDNTWLSVSKTAYDAIEEDYLKMKCYAHPPASVPDGKVLVPAEPTDEMMKAFMEEVTVEVYDTMTPRHFKQAYKAILKAAQQGE